MKSEQPPPALHAGKVGPHLLTRAAVVLALVVTAHVQITRAQAPAGPDIPASASVSSARIAGQRLPAVLARIAETVPEPAAPPETVGADPRTGPGADPRIVEAAAAAVVVPAVRVPIGPELDARINALIAANSSYQLGVALIDVSDGVLHGYGVQDKFFAASTGKIIAAAAYYNLVERGLTSLTAPLGASTAGDQILKMVQHSDNMSWTLILGAVGDPGLRNYAGSIGIDYDRALNALTPAEMARTLELLYTGRLLNAEHTGQLLSYMQNTNFETLIPAAVPPEVNVFHKYGLLFGNLHDASILAKGDRAYVFVVYTLGHDVSDTEERARVIRSLTEVVVAGLF